MIGLVPAGAASAGGLADVKDVADLVSAGITAAAVIVGGSWAYFKFVKGRTYRPRLEVGLFGQWQQVADGHRYHARVTVKNIGASVVRLLQRGTGLRVSVLAAADQPQAPAPATWRQLRVFEIFLEHDWIEPGETVSDVLLLDLGAGPSLVMLEARLVWKWSQRSEEIVVFARRVLPAESSIMER
jgi:hypothetical protein